MDDNNRIMALIGEDQGPDELTAELREQADIQEEMTTAHLDNDSDSEAVAQYLEWYAKKAASIQSEIDILNAQHNRRIKALNRRMEGLESYHGETVRRIVKAAVQDKKRGKFVETAYGRFSVRDTAATIRIESADKFIENAPEVFEEGSDAVKYIRVSMAPDVSAIKKRIHFDGLAFFDKETGEPISNSTIASLGIVGVKEKREVTFKPPTK